MQARAAVEEREETKIINRGIQITEKLPLPFEAWEAEAKRTRGVANNLGTTSDSWER